MYNIDRDWLYQKYINEKLSRNQIAKLVGCGGTTVLRYMKKFNIKRRSQKEALKIDNNRKEKRELMSRVKTGTVFSKQHRENISAGRIAGNFSGKRSPRWKRPEDRVSPLNAAIRECAQNLQWKKDIMARDQYKCTICSASKNLEIDHIVPLSFLIRENKIKKLEDAYNCSKLWDISNGRVLCKSCHKKTDTYSYKAKKYKPKIHAI